MILIDKVNNQQEYRYLFFFHKKVETTPIFRMRYGDDVACCEV